MTDAAMTDDMVLNWNPSGTRSIPPTKAAMRAWNAASASLKQDDQRIADPRLLAYEAGMSEVAMKKGLKALENVGIIQEDPRGGYVIPADIAFMAWKDDQ